MHNHESQCCALISGHDIFYSTSDPVPHLIKLHVTADRRCFLPFWQSSFNLIKLSAASVSFRRVMTAVLTGILKCTRSDASAQGALY